MDAEDVDFDTFEGCLRDLAMVNQVTLAHRATLQFLDQLRRGGHLYLGRPVQILDVGSGYGDLLRAIASWAGQTGTPVALTGVDLNPWSAKAAAKVIHSAMAIRWRTCDVFDLTERYDVVVSSLFTHHLADPQLVRFLVWMEAHTDIAWFINDLRRSRVSYLGFAILARVMRWHPFVQHDGPISIARAFTSRDWRGLLAQADLASAVSVRRVFPYRLCVERIRTVAAR